jgi:hypothetical protein
MQRPDRLDPCRGRGGPGRGRPFAIALNHENPEIDRIITENERFAAIEKFSGSAAMIARASEPRR